MSLTGTVTSRTISGATEKASVAYTDVGESQLRLLQPPGTIGGPSWRQATTTIDPRTHEAVVEWVREVGRVRLNEG